VAPERLLHLVPLVQPEQSMVNEDTGEAITHCTVDQHGGDGGVHPAGEAADDSAGGANQLLDPRDFAVHEVTRGPVRGAAANLEEKIVEDLATPRGVRHLGMKLDTEQRLPAVLEGCYR
jgi:hypothetical protein